MFCFYTSNDHWTFNRQFFIFQILDSLKWKKIKFRKRARRGDIRLGSSGSMSKNIKDIPNLWFAKFILLIYPLKNAITLSCVKSPHVYLCLNMDDKICERCLSANKIKMINSSWAPRQTQLGTGGGQRNFHVPYVGLRVSVLTLDSLREVRPHR